MFHSLATPSNQIHFVIDIINIIIINLLNKRETQHITIFVTPNSGVKYTQEKLRSVIELYCFKPGVVARELNQYYI